MATTIEVSMLPEVALLATPVVRGKNNDKYGVFVTGFVVVALYTVSYSTVNTSPRNGY